MNNDLNNNDNCDDNYDQDYIVDELGKSPVIRFHEVNTRKKMKLFIESNNLIDCKVLHQHSILYNTLVKKYNTNSTSICGYVACAVATYLCEKIKNTKFTKIDEFIEICIKLNDPEEILPYVEKTMKFIQNFRNDVIGTKYESNKPKTGWYKGWVQGWVSNYEISEYMKLIKIPSLYFYRWNQIRDIENIKKDMNRGDPIGHFEFDRIKEEYDLNLYFQNPDFNFIESCNGSLLSIDEWKKTNKNDSESESDSSHTPKVFIVDCVGHFTACATIRIKENFKESKKLIMFNSLWDQSIFSLECDDEDQFCTENYFHGPRYLTISKSIYDLAFD